MEFFFKSGEKIINWDTFLHIIMKVVVAVILAVLISSCEAQKGGAKSAMRNRGRGGSSGRGGTRGRNNYGDSSARGPDDKFGNGTGRRACVGLCYLR